MPHDLRQAIRFLLRRRGVAATAVLTVAICVGLNTAIFSLADSVLFRPLPYQNADRLFVLERTDAGAGRVFSTIPASTVDAARESGVLDAVMSLDYVTAAYPRDGQSLGAPLSLLPVPVEYLDVLGVRVLYGRNFDRQDVGERAVLLTYRAWVKRYGGNRSLLDATLPAADGPSLHVVGILPPEFRAASATAFFSQPEGLLLAPPASPSSANDLQWAAIVRLRDGISRDAAQARLSAIPTAPDTTLRLTSLHEVLGRSSSSTLWLLTAAALVLLVAGCVNLANLVLARGAERGQELAVRAALGGSRWRLVRLVIVESAVISVVGACAGLCLAYWSLGLLVANLPVRLARAVDPAINGRGLAFALIVTIAATLASSVVPAWRLSGLSARDNLRRGRLMARSSRTGRKMLLAIEVASGVVVFVAAVLLGRSLIHLVTRDLGFATDRLAVSILDIGADRDRRPASAATAFRRQLETIRAQRGVVSAAGTGWLPASGWAPDAALFPRGDGREGGTWFVTADFFTTMAIPIIEGRELTRAESRSGAPVAVLNASAARLLFPHGHALGGRVASPGQPTRVIVGVAADWRQSFAEAAIPAMYVPFDAARFRMGQIVVQGDGTPGLADRLKASIARIAPTANISVRRVAANLDREVAPIRFKVLVVGLFAVLTLLLAAVGVYGVISFIATERTREYGIRIALGASRRAVAGLVLRQAAAPMVLGLLAGCVVAVLASRLLQAQLIDTSTGDPFAYVLVVVVLLSTGLLSALAPAMRATRISPLAALRAE